MQSTNVLLFDESYLQAQAIGGLLMQFCDLDRLRLCGSVQTALALVKLEPPDLLILNLQGLCCCWQDLVDALHDRNPDGVLILVTGRLTPRVEAPRHLLKLITNDRPIEALIAAVSQWQRQRRGTALLWDRLDQVKQLSPREVRVFALLGLGLPNRDIAAASGLSLATVATYRKSLGFKLGLSGSELVRAAVLHSCLLSFGHYQGWQPQPPMPQPCMDAPVRGIPR